MISRLLGHKSIAVTIEYLGINQKKAEAASLRHPMVKGNPQLKAELSETTVVRILNEYRICLDGNVELARELEEPAEKEFMLDHGDLQCREIRNSRIRTETRKVKIDLAQDRIDAANERMSQITAEIITNARKELGL